MERTAKTVATKKRKEKRDREESGACWIWQPRHRERLQELPPSPPAPDITQHSRNYWRRTMSTKIWGKSWPPETVWIHLDPILEELRTRRTEVLHLNIFSNAAATSVKPQKILKTTWNSFQARVRRPSWGRGCAQEATDTAVLWGKDTWRKELLSSDEKESVWGRWWKEGLKSSSWAPPPC